MPSQHTRPLADGVRFALINGFDRSGTSMMAKVLASHPRVEALIQPFSSTVLHASQWEEWPAGRRDQQVEDFITRLRAGKIDRDFLESDWFENHSTTTRINPGKLYVIKSTKLHFKAEWWQSTFPDIPYWAAYREPKAILCSLMRNDFYQAWYGDESFRALLEFVNEDRKLPATLRTSVQNAESDLERMSAIVAVRTHVMFRTIPASRRLRFEAVINDPNRVLGAFLSSLGVDSTGHDFRTALRQDHNIVGKEFERSDLWKDYFSSADVERVDQMFESIAPR